MEGWIVTKLSRVSSDKFVNAPAGQLVPPPRDGGTEGSPRAPKLNRHRSIVDRVFE